MGNRLDVREVAQGRWRSILTVLGIDERALSGKHGPCPMCGGKDRFRFDDREGRGAVPAEARHRQRPLRPGGRRTPPSGAGAPPAHRQRSL